MDEAFQGGCPILFHLLLVGARIEILRAPWIAFFPAIILTITIFTFHLIGEGLRQQFGVPHKGMENSFVREMVEKAGEAIVVQKRIRVILVAVFSMMFILLFVKGLTSNDIPVSSPVIMDELEQIEDGEAEEEKVEKEDEEQAEKHEEGYDPDPFGDGKYVQLR